jgi:hypothetical protein
MEADGHNHLDEKGLLHLNRRRFIRAKTNRLTKMQTMNSLPFRWETRRH